MRLIVTNEEIQIQVVLLGASRRKLRAAEATAARLLAAMPAPAPEPARAFGFTGSITADTDVAEADQ